MRMANTIPEPLFPPAMADRWRSVTPTIALFSPLARQTLRPPCSPRNAATGSPSVPLRLRRNAHTFRSESLLATPPGSAQCFGVAMPQSGAESATSHARADHFGHDPDLSSTMPPAACRGAVREACGLLGSWHGPATSLRQTADPSCPRASGLLPMSVAFTRRATPS